MPLTNKRPKRGRPATAEKQSTVWINEADKPLFNRLRGPYTQPVFLRMLCRWLDAQDQDALFDILRGRAEKWRISPQGHHLKDVESETNGPVE